jgi:hypothetical protein
VVDKPNSGTPAAAWRSFAEAGAALLLRDILRGLRKLLKRMQGTAR